MKVRVLQLIDSLDAGGAERMAVSLANELDTYIDTSAICVTRKEGILKKTIKVPYLFLHKKRTLDIVALKRIRTFIIEKRITHLHAHSSSFFFACLVKLTIPRIKIVWHDHYGNSENLSERKYKALYFGSFLFDAIISVNTNLRDWSKKKLNCKNVFFINNFISEAQSPTEQFVISSKDSIKIVCLANIRPQKDHITLLKAFNEVSKKGHKISLHLIGKFDESDHYYKSLVAFIDKHKLNNDVTFYGSVEVNATLLSQFDIGVLSSKSEGLPVSLLEYGMAGLPVVCTSVGECKTVLDGKGLLVNANDYLNFAEALMLLINDEDKRKKMGSRYNRYIIENYASSKVVPEFVKVYSY